MRTLVLLSGGKDSVAAAHVAAQRGLELVGACILRVVGEDSHMFHRPNARWAPMVAEGIGLTPHVRDTEGQEEAELDDLEALLQDAKAATDAEAVVSGALASEYQRTRIERIGERIGLKTFTPLWHKPPQAYMEWLVAADFHVRMVSVSAEGLGRGWLGRELNPRALVTLTRQAQRNRFHIAGEGGEYETLVTDGPNFVRPVQVQAAATHWERDTGWWEVQEASLGPPQTRPAPLPEE